MIHVIARSSADVGSRDAFTALRAKLRKSATDFVDDDSFEIEVTRMVPRECPKQNVTPRRSICGLPDSRQDEDNEMTANYPVRLFVCAAFFAVLGCREKDRWAGPGAAATIGGNTNTVTDPFPPVSEECDATKRLAVEALLKAVLDLDQSAIRDQATQVVAVQGQCHAVFQLRTILAHRPMEYPNVDIPKLEYPASTSFREQSQFSKVIAEQKLAEKKRREELGLASEIEQIRRFNEDLLARKLCAIQALGELGPEAVPTLVRIATLDEFSLPTKTVSPALVEVTDKLADVVNPIITSGVGPLSRKAEAILRDTDPLTDQEERVTRLCPTLPANHPLRVDARGGVASPRSSITRIAAQVRAGDAGAKLACDYVGTHGPQSMRKDWGELLE